MTLNWRHGLYALKAISSPHRRAPPLAVFLAMHKPHEFLPQPHVACPAAHQATFVSYLHVGNQTHSSFNPTSQPTPHPLLPNQPLEHHISNWKFNFPSCMWKTMVTRHQVLEPWLSKMLQELEALCGANLGEILGSWQWQYKKKRGLLVPSKGHFCFKAKRL